MAIYIVNGAIIAFMGLKKWLDAARSAWYGTYIDPMDQPKGPEMPDIAEIEGAVNDIQRFKDAADVNLALITLGKMVLDNDMMFADGRQVQVTVNDAFRATADRLFAAATHNAAIMKRLQADAIFKADEMLGISGITGEL